MSIGLMKCLGSWTLRIRLENGVWPWGYIPASGPFVPPSGPSASVTISFRGGLTVIRAIMVIEFSWGESETEIGASVWEESMHATLDSAWWSEVRCFPSSVPELPAPSIAYDVSVLARFGTRPIRFLRMAGGSDRLDQSCQMHFDDCRGSDCGVMAVRSRCPQNPH
ncbi:hypothetical protein PIB30_086185 [Stylosanthes scabra]|uniref:Uncharacterized protein n=1 Tax=Stylosanthes scabra TaxID=79078 RepID=A0ABU6ZRU5_9FABA|nr:hypothetical protein [Stylosanthes scabra]